MPDPRDARPRSLRATLAVAVLAATIGLAPAAAAQTASEEPTTWRGRDIVGPDEQEFDQARGRIDNLDDRIATNEDRLEAVERELDAVQQRLATATDRLVASQEVAALATQAADDARDELGRVQAELDDARADEEANRSELTTYARNAYMNGPGAADPVLIMVEGLNRGTTTSGSANTLSDAQAAIDAVVRDHSRVVEDAGVVVANTAALEEKVAAHEQVRADKEAEADAAEQAAAEQHATVMALMAETEDRVAEQQALLSELGQDREQAVDALSDLEVAAEEARQAAADKRAWEEEQRRKAEEARKAAEEARRKAAEEARRQAAREEAERQAAEEARREAEEEAERQAAEAAAAEAAAAEAAAEAAAAEEEAAEAERERDTAGSVQVQHNGSLATVGGITVSARIADQLAALLSDARADGIVLGGGGYRSPETTARLRVVNGCPDVYTSPASSCRVPTAIPGSSMHEQGLAIDFTWQGATICFPRSSSNCHGNAAFDWLRANANRYGFYNLPSEAWHWSTNGN